MVKFFKEKTSITMENILNFSHDIKADLPKEYIELLLKHNGASVENNIVEIQNGQNANFKELIPIENIKKYIKEINGKYLNNFLFPFALDDSGNYFLMDKKNNSIYFYDHEFKGKEAISKIANSFREFLNRIQPYDIQKLPMPKGKILYVNTDFINKLKNQ